MKARRSGMSIYFKDYELRTIRSVISGRLMYHRANLLKLPKRLHNIAQRMVEEYEVLFKKLEDKEKVMDAKNYRNKEKSN